MKVKTKKKQKKIFILNYAACVRAGCLLSGHDIHTAGTTGFCGADQGLRERGAWGGTMTSGPMGFRGPIRGLSLGPIGFRGRSRGPIEMTLRNQYAKDRRPFFYHIKTLRKLWHYPCLFWSSQNRRCTIFELTPIPRLALGAPSADLGSCPQIQK